MSTGNTASCKSIDSSDITITVNIKFNGKTIPISILRNSTVKDLKSLLQPLTDVLPRGMKLFFKGKVLIDEMTLRSSELIHGSKVMLVASQGLDQGGGPVLKDARTVPISRTGDSRPISIDINVLGRWKAIGVISLADRKLKAIPDEVWTVGSSARVLDLTGNSICSIPDQIGCLSSLQKLYLTGNGLSDGLIGWEGVSSLKNLTFLYANNNCFTTLPPALGCLTSLRNLDVSNNQLTSLPVEIGLLTQLECLKANNNRIRTIPTSMGDCNSLMEVNLSSNIFSELPFSFQKLIKLKSLELNHTGLNSLPTLLFKKCRQLKSLDVHSTEITIDMLRQYEGWEDFDNRRRMSIQKQLDSKVGADFNEAADKC